MNIDEWQAKLDKGLRSYIKSHGLIREEGAHFRNMLDNLGEFGRGCIFLWNAICDLFWAIALLVTYPVAIVACYNMEKRAIIKAKAEQREEFDSLFGGDK